MFDKVHVTLEGKRAQTLLKLIHILAVMYLAGDTGSVSYCSLPICGKQNGSLGRQLVFLSLSESSHRLKEAV